MTLTGDILTLSTVYLLQQWLSNESEQEQDV